MSFFLECKQLSKHYAQAVVFEQVDLTIAEGEIISFVGPSGCGKTTLLRCIAGLEQVSSGQILLQEEEITHLPARKRPIVMMFQEARLFPHLSVLDNIIYGLRSKRIPKTEQRALGLEMLSKIELTGYEQRYPYELSGGQQQRVALARALVVKPEVLLLDEPFSSLDPELRVHLRTWVKKLLKEEGITALFVTHDKEEAMLLGDRVAVMKHGQIQQIGNPTEVYRFPQNEVVADFFSDGLFLEEGQFIPIDQLKVIPYHVSVQQAEQGANQTSKSPIVHDTAAAMRSITRGIVLGTWWQAGQMFVQLELEACAKGLAIAVQEPYTVGDKVVIMVKEDGHA